MMIRWHVGDVIRKLRVLAKQKQSDIASKAGLRVATVSTIETSGKYDPDSLRQIARTLKTTDAEILSSIPIHPKNKGSLDSDTSIPEHKELHDYFEYLLQQNNEISRLIAVNVVVYCAQLTGDPPDFNAIPATLGSDPVGGEGDKGGHGPFSADAPLADDAEIGPYETPIKTRRPKP